jgi:hypothetical protein
MVRHDITELLLKPTLIKRYDQNEKGQKTETMIHKTLPLVKFLHENCLFLILPTGTPLRMAVDG